MTTTMPTPRTTSALSQGAMLLANVATWWGFVVLPVYAVAFLLILPYRLGTRPEPAVVTSLPLTVPLIGLALALPAVYRCLSDRSLAWVAGIAVVLNLIPVALAIALRVMG